MSEEQAFFQREISRCHTELAEVQKERDELLTENGVVRRHREEIEQSCEYLRARLTAAEKQNTELQQLKLQTLDRYLTNVQKQIIAENAELKQRLERASLAAERKRVAFAATCAERADLKQRLEQATLQRDEACARFDDERADCDAFQLEIRALQARCERLTGAFVQYVNDRHELQKEDFGEGAQPPAIGCCVNCGFTVYDRDGALFHYAYNRHPEAMSCYRAALAPDGSGTDPKDTQEQ